MYLFLSIVLSKIPHINYFKVAFFKKIMYVYVCYVLFFIVYQVTSDFHKCLTDNSNIWNNKSIFPRKILDANLLKSFKIKIL